MSWQLCCRCVGRVARGKIVVLRLTDKGISCHQLFILFQLESFKNFDFDMWRQRYMAWIRAKKLRITDFFRRQDKDGDGSLSRREFVEGMLASSKWWRDRWCIYLSVSLSAWRRAAGITVEVLARYFLSVCSCNEKYLWIYLFLCYNFIGVLLASVCRCSYVMDMNICVVL